AATTTAPTVGSASSSSQAVTIACAIASVSALRRSGAARVRTATPPSRSMRTSGELMPGTYPGSADGHDAAELGALAGGADRRHDQVVLPPQDRCPQRHAEVRAMPADRAAAGRQHPSVALDPHDD